MIPGRANFSLDLGRSEQLGLVAEALAEEPATLLQAL
jgi:hypothetical protein